MATTYVLLGGYDSNGRVLTKIFPVVDPVSDAAAISTASSTAGSSGIWTGLTKQCLAILTDDHIKAIGGATEATLTAIAADIAQLVDELDDATNTRTTTLTSGSTFTGGFVDLSGYEAVAISVLVDQDSASNGLVISWSDDGTNAVMSQSFTVLASADFMEILPRRGRYYKVVYTNGGTNQGSFALRTRKIPRFSGLGTTNLPQIVSLSTALPAGSSTIGNVNLQTSKTLLRASIDVSSSGDNTPTIAAPGSGLKIKIVSLFLHNSTSSDTTVVLKSDSTSINGSGVVLKDSEKLLYFNGLPKLNTWDLGTNEPLIINLDGANNISGYITYYVE